MTPEAQRAKADYFDVWSGMFRDNFYKPQEDWCNARNMEYMVHLNHEENAGRGEGLIANEGSFWRDMRYVGVPGIDNLNQIGPGIVADFPKLAASAAHVYGRPLVWEEEGGGVGAEREICLRLPTRPRGQLHEHPRPQCRSAGAPRGHRLVRQPRPILAGRRPAGGAGRSSFTRPTACGWATRNPTTSLSSW